MYLQIENFFGVCTGKTMVVSQNDSNNIASSLPPLSLVFLFVFLAFLLLGYLIKAVDSEGRTPLDLSTDASIRRMVRTEEMVRMSGENFDLLEAVEVNDTTVSN